LTGIQSAILGLSISPNDAVDNNGCRDLETTANASCYRIDGEMTLVTRQVPPAQTTELTNFVNSVLDGTISNPDFLQDLQNVHERLEDIVSSDQEFIATLPPVNDLTAAEAASKREELRATWILAPAAAIGAIVIAVTIKFKRRQWLSQKGTENDDGSFSLSSYGSWFRKKGGNVQVDENGNVETEVVV